MQHRQRGRSNDNEVMRDRICLITGATSGIGLVTARELAARGASVVLVGRNEAKTRAVVETIRQQLGARSGTLTGTPGGALGAVGFLLADLSSQAAVRDLAETFRQRFGAVHVLVNNAGALYMRRQQSVDGLEMTLAVNHLAPFLLTNLLLDTLRAGAPARVVTVASAAHRGANGIAFDDLQQRRGRYGGYRGYRVYSQSKLANIMFTYELARRLTGSGVGVTANTLHPGAVASGFGRHNGLVMGVAMAIVRHFEVSPEQGAQTSIYLASSPEVETVTGQYFIECKPARSSPASYDVAAQQRLWQISEQLTGLA